MTKYFITILMLASLHTFSQIPAGYKGKPYHDSIYRSGPQQVPGRIELAYYDFGGKGVASHDTTPENEGSKLNRSAGHGWRDHLLHRR